MKITREELYRRVWETPVRTLAKEFDISDVGLSKSCRRADIPLPPVGYWTKVQHGQTPRKPPLPRGENITIGFDAAKYRTPATQRKRSEVPALRVEVPVVGALETMPPFTRATAEKLRKAKATAGEFVFVSGAGVFSCVVGQASAEPAIAILNAIESALPGLGAKLVKGEKRLAVEFEGQRVEFRLTEQTTRTAVLVKDKYYKGSENTDYTYAFSGQFALTIDGYFEGRKRWADGKRQALKDKLGDFVLGLVEAARAMKRRAEELAAQKLRWEEAARKRQEEELHRRYMVEFRDNLIAEATAARESVLMAEYLGRLRERLAGQHDDLPETARAWLDRADEIAAFRDPTGRRVRRLKALTETESYYGYFGQPLVGR